MTVNLQVAENVMHHAKEINLCYLSTFRINLSK